MSSYRLSKFLFITGFFLFLYSSTANANCLIAWGAGYGRDVPSLDIGVAISVGPDHGLVLLPDHTVARWGNAAGTLMVPPTATNVVAIAAGYRHAVAARADGSVVCWGSSSYGQTGVPDSATNVVAVAAGQTFSAALKGDGTVVTWGQWYIGGMEVPVLPADLTGVVAISAGYNHLMCLLEDDTVRCFGWYNFGQTEVPSGLSGVKAISAGGDHCLALKTDGTVIGWGYGYSSGETAWTGMKAIGAGYRHDLGIRVNGTVVARGTDTDGQTVVPGTLSNVLAVGGGETFSVALVQSCAAPTVSAPTAVPSASVCTGTAVTLSQTATGGTEPYSFQWVRNGNPVEGATTSSFLVENPVNGDQIVCIVGSSCGASNASEAVTLLVAPQAAAPNLEVARPAGISANIKVVEDAAAAAGMAVTGVSGGSASATITFSGPTIFYTSTATNSLDSFNYTVGNGDCSATGTINITVVSAGGLARDIRQTANGMAIRFAAIPGLVYEVQKSDTADFSTYTQVLTIVVPEDGLFEYVDPNSSSGTAYYRLVR